MMNAHCMCAQVWFYKLMHTFWTFFSPSKLGWYLNKFNHDYFAAVLKDII